jgi:ParB family chromosome partitioning protein
LGRTSQESEHKAEAAGAVSTPPATSSATKIPMEQLQPNPFQPRKDFDSAGLDELVASIRRHGVLQPIVVRPIGPSSSTSAYQIVAGERRWRCARQAGLTSIPALIRTDLSDDDVLEIALVENVQRRDLNAIERGQGFRDMVERLGLTQAQVAERVGLKRATVTNHVRLLELPEKAQRALAEGLVTMGHARALLGLPEGDQLRVVERIAREGLSVRQVESWASARCARGGASRSESEGPRPGREAWQEEIGRRLRERLGTKVSIHNGAGFRGQIVIDYFSRDDLDRLLELIAPAPRLS